MSAAWALEFDLLAQMEALHAYQWYARQVDGLGEQFEEALDELLQSLQTFPRAYPELTNQPVRRALMERFPYAVYYEIIEEGEPRLRVLAILHTNREPEEWQRRL